MATQERSPDQGWRKAAVIGHLVDVTFGSMWWIKEHLWVRAIPTPFRYRANPQRHEHPGISILEEQPLQHQVPVMHGSSNGTEESVWISGFSENNPSQYTAFGHLISPHLIPRIWIGHFPVRESEFRHEWVRLFGPDSFPPKNPSNAIRRVRGRKTKATPQECAQLRELLNHRGVL